MFVLNAIRRSASGFIDLFTATPRCSRAFACRISASMVCGTVVGAATTVICDMSVSAPRACIEVNARRAPGCVREGDHAVFSLMAHQNAGYRRFQAATEAFVELEWEPAERFYRGQS